MILLSHKGVDLMPHIIPIKDLKDTAAISHLCSESTEPIYITKNGYGDMVIMSMKTYEERMLISEINTKLEAAEKQISEGNISDARDSLKRLREKYNV